MPSSGSANFVVTLEETATAYTGATIGHERAAAHGFGRADDRRPVGGPAIAGRTVTFTLGSGSSAQTCIGTTDADGTAACTIASVEPIIGSDAGHRHLRR